MELKTLLLNDKNGWTANNLGYLNSNKTLIFAFSAPELLKNTDIFTKLAEQFPDAHIVGCSTAGEIYEDTVHDNSISCAIARFINTDIKLQSVMVNDFTNAFEIGKHLARKLMNNKLKGIMVFSDGMNVNGTELVNGFNAVLPKNVIVSGGLAGDGSAFQSTWVFKDNLPACQAVTAIGFYGEHVGMSFGSKGGWDIFGPERLITKSKDNILYEIDGKPALKLYKEYLGERASGLPATGLLFPLAIRKDVNSTEQVVRTILNINEKDQSLIFAGDVPQGYCAQLMKANMDRLIDGAAIAGQHASCRQTDSCLAIAISCVGRRLVLGERTDEEVEATLDSLPTGTKQIGFYSYGEISPNEQYPSSLHNQTMTLTTIWENIKNEP